MKTVYLVRHGETEGNLNNFSQTPDTPLTEAGHRGAKAVAERLSHLEIDLLVASPFTRAQETASYVSETISLPVTTVESFHEILKPEEVRGKTYNEDNKDVWHQYAIDLWTEERNLPGMEHYVDILRRVKDALSFLEERDESKIAVVSHGDFLRHLVSYVLLGQVEDAVSHKTVSEAFVRINNVGVTVVEYDGDNWRVKIYNDHAHFAE